MERLSLRSDLLDLKRNPAIQAELLWVYRGDVIQDDWIVPAEMPCAAIFVEKGGIELEWEGGRAACGTRDVFLSREGVRRHRCKKGTSLLSVGYDLHWSGGPPIFDEGLNLYLPGGRNTAAPSHPLAQATLRLFQRLHPGKEHISFAESLHDEPDQLSTYFLRKTVLWEWFHELYRTLSILGIKPTVPHVQDSIVLTVRDLLDSWPLNEPLAPEKLIRHVNVGVGWRRVQQLFQQDLQISPRQYFERRRLLQAKARLREPSISIKAVASELGFQTLSHFSVWFSKQTGKPPRRFQLGG